jgi:hypothetical protein
MLMNVLQTPNFATICGACTFVVGFGPASKAQSLRKPWILRSAVAVSFFYASLAGIGAISESWLSSTSEAVPFLQHIPYQGSFPMLTRQLNRTLCDSTDIQAPNYLHLCGMIKAGYVVNHTCSACILTTTAVLIPIGSHYLKVFVH